MVKLSIVAPIYGVEKYIREFAESLFSQTEDKEVEYVFVNDCTKDDSVIVLSKVVEEHPSLKERVHIYDHTENKGLAAARLTGLNYAVGDYVWFVDSDDRIMPGAVELLLNIIDGGKDYEAVWFSAVWENDKTKIRKRVTPQNLLTTITWHNLWGCIIKRDFLYKNEILPIPGLNFGEDRIMTTRVACVAKKQIQIDDKLYFYRCVNETSYSNTVKHQSLLQDAEGVLIISRYYDEHYPKRDCRMAQFINNAFRYCNIKGIEGVEFDEMRENLSCNMSKYSTYFSFLFFLFGKISLKWQMKFVYYMRNIFVGR